VVDFLSSATEGILVVQTERLNLETTCDYHVSAASNPLSPPARTLDDFIHLIRPFFNLLGPMSNPAKPRRQVIRADETAIPLRVAIPRKPPFADFAPRLTS
jgi:hypothetical protein